MAVNPIDLLTSAEAFKSIAKTEADFRGVVSRFYYATYHGALNFHNNLDKPGISKPQCGVHENLYNQLSKPSIENSDPKFKTSMEIAYYFKKILFNRRLADYQLDKNLTEKNVDIVAEECNSLFSEI